MARIQKYDNRLVKPPAAKSELRENIDWAVRYLRRLQRLRSGILEVHGSCNYDTEQYYLYRRKIDRVNWRIGVLMRYSHYLAGKALQAFSPKARRSHS